MEVLHKLSLLLAFICAMSHFQCVQSANILFFGALGTHSTRLSNFPTMEALVEKGHNVTYLSPFENFEDAKKKTKINHYLPKKWAAAMGNWEDHVRFFDLRAQGNNPYVWFDIQDVGIQACEVLYSDPEYVEFVKTNKFDLVVLDSANNECVFGIVHLSKAKFVVLGTSTVYTWFPETYGFPDESSSIVDLIFDFNAREGMSFSQRVMNAISPILFQYRREWTYFPVIEEITRNALGLRKDELPSFREIEKNVSLILLTTHFTIDMPRSYPPNVVTIGGAVIDSKTKKPMPKEMEEFVNSAKKGFIYISFGTVAEFTNFAREVQLEFIRAVGAFPDIKFLWKASVEINETLPKNVMTTKWAPQQTVLAHPNVKAFVTHCGMGSTAELVHFGVPGILIPVLADQDVNARMIESRGAGIQIEVTTLKQHELERAISEILNNYKYRDAMTKLSKAFNDRPMKPVETAVWWMEYVLRHENSNEYLSPLSIRQPWWKKRQVDVWLALGAGIVGILSLSLVVIYTAIKTIFRSFSAVKSKTKLKSN